MSKLEELRKIAGGRSGGPWTISDMSPTELWTSHGYSKIDRYADAAFIATAANTYDLLLDIAEASSALKKSISDRNYGQLSSVNISSPIIINYILLDNLRLALAALETDRGSDE